MTGSSQGFTYDKRLDQVTLLDRVSLHMAPDGRGDGVMDIAASNAVFNRADKTIRFTGGLKAIRGKQVIQSDAALAHLSADEERLEAIELRGNSRITGTEGGAGGLRSVAGRDVDLTYGPDGQAIQHAVVVGGGVIQLAGEKGHQGRQIGAGVLELSLAPDGSTPTGLTAHDAVQLMFPAETGIPARTINAQQLDSKGDAGHGLTSAHFEGAVQYREQGSSVDRRAASQALDVTLGPGLSTIDEAQFSRAVRFEDQTMEARSAAARYVLDKGTLDLSGIGPTGAVPRVDTKQIGIDALQISMVLDGPMVKASGSGRDVKSVMKQQSDSSKPSDTKLPAMLKKDQDVVITAGDLDYDGKRSRATYTGTVRLNQGDTSINASTMTIDDRTGDLEASGSGAEVVATSMVREETGADHTTERVHSNAKSKEMKYEEALRRLTYTGDAHVVGPAGDMAAAKIELYLKQSGDELERVEAYEKVVLTETGRRKTTGNRLTYTSADEQYVIVGTPVHVVEACGRDTTGKTLTLFKASDRFVMDGSADATRTQTTGTSSSCP